MTPRRADPGRTTDEPEASRPDASQPADGAADEVAQDAAAEPDAAEAGDDDVQIIDLVDDELTLARGQLEAGLPGLAEGTVLRRLAWLEADGATPSDETDALRLLLAEALWRQGRPASARRTLESIRPSSPQRRLPVAGIIEADVLAAAGERDRAAGTVERVVDAIGSDAVFEIRGAMPGGPSWPLPADLRAEPPPPARPPWTAAPADGTGARPARGVDDERIAAGRGRMEEARVAYVAGDLERGDAEMSIAVRLEPGLANDGVRIIEPTLGARPAAERLLLYGDLLRAAGRQAEADRAYDRAAGRWS